MKQLGFILSALLLAVELINAKSMGELRVMVSQSEPFAIHDSNRQSLKGLDVKMMDHFARKLHLEVKYIIANESLNVEFSLDDHTEHSMRKIENLYV